MQPLCDEFVSQSFLLSQEMTNLDISDMQYRVPYIFDAYSTNLQCSSILFDWTWEARPKEIHECPQHSNCKLIEICSPRGQFFCVLVVSTASPKTNVLCYLHYVDVPS